MITSLNQVLKIAEARKIAIGSFNTPNLESLQAILSAAEELNEPVIIMHAQLHEDIGVCKIDEIGPLMVSMAEKSTAPVCVHLDHGTDFAYVKKALDIGFTSVMFDGSEGDEEENIANTSLVVETASRFGASVEGEVGSLGARADGYGNHQGESIYTDPLLAQRFVKETGIDALACAFGTVHGISSKKMMLDYDRITMIKEVVDVPLVMRGASGLTEAELKETIRRGIRKINYYSNTSKVAAEAIAKKSYTQFHDVVKDATEAIKADVKEAIRIFAMK